MRRSKNKKPQRNNQKWMVTFSDMILLILVFFVMLFSMSVIDAKKFQAIADSFQNKDMFDSLPSIIELDNMAEDRSNYDTSGSRDGDGNDGDLDALLKDVQSYLTDHELNEQITATRDERGVVLVLQEQLLFETGKADILKEARPFLNKVGKLLGTLPNTVKVEGHTDNRPISTYRYPSNWELSGARAGSVIRYLTEQYSLDPERFIATGYGETRPVAPNDSVENLRKNRRVVIVITSPEYEDKLDDNQGL
ncbi:flagellar motor protein MotS [Alteribacillus iranensis]|uniref:Chemotaxis protein MotB n=1 Tax=Alteribacillus iranensis TaxID=930128 RepID=A0A1I2FKH5_9BACI|nr:flagellar motor protein MotS [Alteribacillus iranensis]SFF05100.1 chemotaxis protein MotB [Alteribacillus iranensis]